MADILQLELVRNDCYIYQKNQERRVDAIDGSRCYFKTIRFLFYILELFNSHTFESHSNNRRCRRPYHCRSMSVAVAFRLEASMKMKMMWLLGRRRRQRKPNRLLVQRW